MRRILLAPLPLILCASAVSAADWLTDGGDTKRTNWQKDETIFTTANVKDMKLLWKIKLDNEPRQMHSLLEPLVIGSLETKQRTEAGRHSGRRLGQCLRDRCGDGELLWKKHFESTYQEPPGGTRPQRALSRRNDGERDHRSR